ncbi:MAG: hypothetical protein H6Q10_1244 [Acidobacteria bacterium]|nr:hypothetical protein [Acidobacteriota bacterium]
MPGHGRRVAALAVAAAAWAAAAPAQEPAGQGAGSRPLRSALSAVVSVSRPSDEVFRQVYGSVVVPLSAQVDVPVGWNGLIVFGGARYARSSGEASTVGDLPVVAPLRFRLASVRAGAGWGWLAGPWQVTVAAGPSVNWYREEWAGFDLVVSGREVGFVGEVTAGRSISRRLSVVVRGEYSTAKATPRQDPTLPDAELGGLDLGGGIAFRF